MSELIKRIISVQMIKLEQCGEKGIDKLYDFKEATGPLIFIADSTIFKIWEKYLFFNLRISNASYSDICGLIN